MTEAVLPIAPEEARDIVAALRAGVVPARGLHHFATGLDALMGAIEDELQQVQGGRGRAKWIRGEYGSGKTFASRLLCARARARGFATSEVQISINDTPLHHLETVYRRLMERLTTSSDGTGAFRAIVDAWLFEVGEEVTRLRGVAEDDPAFPEAVEARLEDKLAALSAQNPAFAQVLRAYHRALAEDDFKTAQGLLAWLAGQPHVDQRSILARAGVRGAVDGQAALTFLRGVLMLLRQSAYNGLVLVLDEVETIQRMPPPTREKSLNALRQLVDQLANDELPGLYLVVTGTPAFYDDYKGLKSLAPLYQRVTTKFEDDPRHDNLLAPQVRLLAFDERRLVDVGRRIRALYPAKNPDRIARRVDDTLLEALARTITSGFGGKISIAPRTFLRELVDLLDKVDQHETYDPRASYALQLDETALSDEEIAAVRAASPAGSRGPLRLEA